MFERSKRFLFIGQDYILKWWMAVLLLLPIARITIFIRRRTESGYASVDAWALLDIVFCGICGCILIFQKNKINYSPLSHTGMSFLLFYYVYAAFSFLWRLPGTSMPYIVYRAGCMFVMILYAFFFLSHFKTQRQAFFALLNYLCIILLLSAWRQFRLCEFHTNSYSVIAGMILALSLTVCKVGLFKYRQMIFYILWGGICLMLGTSAGSNVAFACTLLFIFSIRKDGFNIGLFLLGSLLIYLLYLFAFETVFQLLFPDKNIENIGGMTGRARIWQVFIDAWRTQPLLGLGFAVGERSGSYFGYVYTLSTHNGFLSILVNTGIVGCLFWLVFFVKFGGKIIERMSVRSPYAYSVAATMVMILVNNNTIPIIGSTYDAIAMSAMLILSFFSIWEFNSEETNCLSTSYNT